VISFHPAVDALHKRFGRSRPDLEAVAAERWTIAPAATRHIPPARYIPAQLDRITHAVFGSVAEVVRDFRGGYDARQQPTLGFRLRNVDLVDGVLYTRGGCRHLRPRRRRAPVYRRPAETTSGTLYESWVGNRWFGNWLFDDCVTYALADRFGAPVTSALHATEHMRRYEHLLGFAPRRVDRVHFDELVIFRDVGGNADREARADHLRRRLIGDSQPAAHPGVFLLRGDTGARRVLINEIAIAEAFRERRGFTIIDPLATSVDAIVAACAGARVIAGVEGSHLVHGLVSMPRDAVLFTIQPPDRACSVLKTVADRQRQVFAFVVGIGGCDGFIADWDEIERTLDMALN
jgi:hypothetical protein